MSTRKEPLTDRGRSGADPGRRVFSDPETAHAIATWRAAPRAVLVPWLSISALVSVLMLGAVWLVARASSPFHEAIPLEGRSLDDLNFILERNVIVLALHGFACVAAYLAGARVPAAAARYRGWRRRAYLACGPLAMVLVGLLILRSMIFQISVLGYGAAALADGLGIGPGQLLLIFSLHALPELTGAFLPLAAWLWLHHRGRHDQMMAGAIASCLVGAALVFAAALIEVWVTPHLVQLALA